MKRGWNGPTVERYGVEWETKKGGREVKVERKSIYEAGYNG
jgi:hypothetical protein